MPKRKLTPARVRIAKSLLKEGWLKREVADLLGVSRMQLYRVLKSTSKK